MKKIFFLLSLLSSMALLEAYDGFYENDRFYGNDCLSEECYINECGCDNWEVEVRGAGVYPSSKRFRKIYSDWAPEVQLEVARKVWGDSLYAWANVSYLWRNGHSEPLHNKTNVSLVPISIGLKYLFPLTCDLNAYLGGGAAYSFLYVRDHSEFVRKRTTRRDWGGVIKSGLQYNLCNGFFIDFFADYLFQHFSKPHRDESHRNVETNSVNLNSLHLGLGLGMRF